MPFASGARGEKFSFVLIQWATQKKVPNEYLLRKFSCFLISMCVEFNHQNLRRNKNEYRIDTRHGRKHLFSVRER